MGLIAWCVLVLMIWYSIECCGSVVLGELVDCWWVVYGCGCLYCYAYWLLFLLIVLSIVVLVCALARFICFGCGLICFGFSFVVVVYLLVCGFFGCWFCGTVCTWLVGCGWLC